MGYGKDHMGYGKDHMGYGRRRFSSLRRLPAGLTLNLEWWLFSPRC
jgi:hypothetical protein